MSKNSFFPTMLLIIFTFLQCSDNITDPKEVRQLTEIEKQVVSSSDEFGFKLFKKINKFEGEKKYFHLSTEYFYGSWYDN